MAIDYLHRLIVEGPDRAVRAFRRQLHREYPRTIGGETWTEVVPFSFAALYELAPAARRAEPEVPYDPYDLSVWPARRITTRLSEVRYQFHTRNLEMPRLLKPLSRALPSLTFMLATLCFDDSTVESYRFARGVEQKWHTPSQDFQWERARKRFHLAGDDVYIDDDAEHWVEEELLEEGLRYWATRRRGKSARRARRRQWWNQLILRDLATEHELAVIEVAATLSPRRGRKARRKKTGRS
jgi:hypothetical protein